MVALNAVMTVCARSVAVPRVRTRLDGLAKHVDWLGVCEWAAARLNALEVLLRFSAPPSAEQVGHDIGEDK